MENSIRVISLDQGLLCFFPGASPSPSPTISVPNIDGFTGEAPIPITNHGMVKAWLLSSFSEDILSVVVGSNTSQDVWLSLAKHFNRVSSTRLFELQRRLQTL